MDFHGSLSEFQLPDVIQFLSGAGKTGVLKLLEGGQRGAIYLARGRIVHAELGGLTGEEAFCSMVVLSAGEFHFEPEVTTEVSTISRSNTSLLMEAARRSDEWKVMSEQIPGVDWIPEFVLPEGSEAGKQITLNTSEWIVLSKIDGRRSLRAIAQAANLSLFHTCRLLYGLVSTNLIRLREPELVPPHADPSS
ncbi:MAG: DUF4388 domain-containing protein [Acidobacteriota bacterium]